MFNPRSFPSKLIRTLLMFAFLILLFLSARFSASADAQGNNAGVSDDGLWSDVNERSLNLVGERWIIPQSYRTLALDVQALEDLLARAPLEFSPEAQAGRPVITLPLPDGTYGRFSFVEAPIMAPELAAKFPQIRTYLGSGLDDPGAAVRFDFTPAGFHAMIFSSAGMVFIDPYSRGDLGHYLSYYKRDFTPNAAKIYEEWGPLGDPEAIQPLVEQFRTQETSSDGFLRTYRAAVAATGEYTQYHGGTKVAGMAAIVTTMNRVVGIYERDVAVRMVLVPDNDDVVFTNASTDPYSNNNGGLMLSQNQTTLDSLIGDANYDIGHVFSTGGGGVAYLGVPCDSGWKAGGVTGSSAPVGDPFDVDYVAHEMGHQYGANHPFNGSEGACSGGNRNASTAYEPGSGSTIMAYAGICGSQDLQPHSDDYFHGISLDEINAYITIGVGNSCPVKTATSNLAPVVDAGTGGFSIPVNTPFSLTGSATDGNGDPLTYTWEQFDLGPAGHPDSPSGGAPIFRSFKPVSEPTRTFPKLGDLLNNTHTIGELLPTYSRTLTFRLTARDNHNYPNGGRTGKDTISFSVTSAAGPFLVTAPNTAVTWVSGDQETVTWNVAGTTAAPVSCPNVDILLSTDGGYTYPQTLAAGTPNDGSQTISVPYANTTAARVKVACANNIFFDISNINFEIEGYIFFPLVLK